MRPQPLLPLRGSVTLDQVAIAISIAHEQLGVPDEYRLRSLLVDIEGRPAHFASVLRVGFPAATATTESVIHRAGRLWLTEVGGPASHVLKAMGLESALARWQEFADSQTTLNLQSDGNVSRVPGNNRTLNPWSVEPGWVVDIVDNTPKPHLGSPSGPFYDPNTQFFAKSIGEAAWKWLGDPELRGANMIPNRYRIILRDPRAWIADYRLDVSDSDHSHATLMLHVVTSLRALPPAHIVVVTASRNGANDSATVAVALDRPRLEIPITLPANTISIHLLSTTSDEWFDEYEENEYYGEHSLLRIATTEPHTAKAGVPSQLTLAPLRPHALSASAPKAFVSYSWDSEEHRRWVESLATTLRSHGIDVMLDQWSLAFGDQLTHFMEQSVSNADFVLIVCTPKYKVRSDSRVGGVGYEGDIMTAEVLRGASERKFIPVLREGSKEDAIPTWLQGRLYVDLSSDSIETALMQLVSTIHKRPDGPPPLGPVPA